MVEMWPWMVLKCLEWPRFLQFQQVHDFGAGSLMFLAYDASLREELLQLGDALHVKVRLRPGG